MRPGVRALGDAFTQQASEAADGLAGGFGGQQKFPSAPQLALLLDAQRREPADELGEFLRLTFGAMASLGLRDQIGGGFFRYVTDPGWQVPHFEKMLYDNALLAELYFDAADVLGGPAFERVAMDTVRFMVRELGSPLGGFHSSLSAVDAAGVEGGYYLFAAEELDRLLDDRERNAAGIAWGLDGASPIGHGYLPVQAAESGAEVARAAGVSVEEAAARLDSARHKLLEARSRRELPRDEKRLAGWNGLALSALVRASLRPGGARFEAPARGVVRFLAGELWDGTTLVRTRFGEGAGKGADEGSGEGADARPATPATLQDYAYVAPRPDRVREGTRTREALGHCAQPRRRRMGAVPYPRGLASVRCARASLRRRGARDRGRTDALALGGAARRHDARRGSLRRRCVARASARGLARRRCRPARSRVLPRDPHPRAVALAARSDPLNAERHRVPTRRDSRMEAGIRLAPCP